MIDEKHEQIWTTEAQRKTIAESAQTITAQAATIERLRELLKAVIASTYAATFANML